ncbi:coproporphyrinogen III oxidase [Sphingobium sp. 22B]|uniref:radical SAM family heme chaperone HemW n=1 Tax=unclassified Sphingobium TaxID=2611147 RepID=UPI000784C809|nr:MULTISPECIES: radical SAM family heme chaperone HemW [unclassified Sphingobium]KXU30599.1 coproporphyrinogen III oxidase [Sphingobium sp. AM]KYC30434.1 coproporphyrinogen III oxidase [Sphingobium sp. 22B]OAP30156.1 coproporphyrinogen III oxidase [Sphingobium sp. 20006FA]
MPPDPFIPAAAPDEPLALYVHWPFCVSKCPYCDFNSHVRAEIDSDAWRAALLSDLAHEAALSGGRPLSSIFFGGGTPSLMPPDIVEALIDAATRHWRLTSDIEITLEANPSSVEAARFADLAAAGVNRVSLGLQALEDEALHFLGRAHDVREGLAALDVAQSVFGRVNFDLIYARPGQSLADWESELARGLSFGTDHLSLYQLTIEPGTRFATLVARGELNPADPDHAADLYERTQAMTAAAGIPAYEISNHARPGQESRHNLTYWRYGDYVGIGPGAHGRRDGLATLRHRKPENWMNAVARNGHGLQSEDPLDGHDRAREALLMGLRLGEGVELERIARMSRMAVEALVDAEAVARLAGHGLVRREGQRLRIEPAGMLLLDAILPEIVAV